MAHKTPTAQIKRAWRTVTLVPGDGIGREITASLVSVFAAANVPILWDKYSSPSANDAELARIIESVSKTGALLKGPLGTPIGGGHASFNMELRKTLGLYANLRPFKTMPGVKSRYDGVDLIVVRENTEGEYSGVEHEVSPGVIESQKVTTRKACARIAEFAFKMATLEGRRKVTAVHKANIQKKSDGLFLECCREVAARHPKIGYEEMIVDNCCMQLVLNPERFDVLVLPNLYGDIVSDLCAGLIGGLGIAPSANIGTDKAMFEAVHGTAPDLAGKGIANPTALILSGVLLLRHLGLHQYADRIENAVRQVIAEGDNLTSDLGGTATTGWFTHALVRAIDRSIEDVGVHSSAKAESCVPLCIELPVSKVHHVPASGQARRKTKSPGQKLPVRE